MDMESDVRRPSAPDAGPDAEQPGLDPDTGERNPGEPDTGGDGQDGSIVADTTPGALRVVTWNAHDLYDDIADNCDRCPYYDATQTPSTAEYATKVDGVVKTLAKLGGDVVFLEEVENQAVLDRIAASPELAGFNYQTRLLVRGNDPRGVNIGLLSRIAVDRFLSHRTDRFTNMDQPTTLHRFARDALEVHMTVRGKPVTFIGVHFKAKVQPDDPDQRLAEAQRSREIADELLKADEGAYVFILGDFNDYPGSAPLVAVRDGRSKLEFRNAAESLPQEQQYSYTYSGNRQLIDHLFASPAAAARLNKDSVVIVHDKGVPSDHDPVAATYTVP